MNNLEGEYNNGSLALGAIATLASLPFAKYINPVPGGAYAIGGLDLSTELAFTGSSIEDVKDDLEDAIAIIITTTINSGAIGTAFSSTISNFYHPNGTLFLTMSYSNHE